MKLIWKFEDGPDDAPDKGAPDDVGPAWLHAPGTERDQQDVADGAWITRAQAQALAAELRCELDLG